MAKNDKLLKSSVLTGNLPAKIRKRVSLTFCKPNRRQRCLCTFAHDIARVNDGVALSAKGKKVVHPSPMDKFLWDRTLTLAAEEI
jgi:hypothetical protein